MNNENYTVVLVNEGDGYYAINIENDGQHINGVLFKREELLELYQLLLKEFAVNY